MKKVITISIILLISLTIFTSCNSVIKNLSPNNNVKYNGKIAMVNIGDYIEVDGLINYKVKLCGASGFCSYYAVLTNLTKNVKINDLNVKELYLMEKGIFLTCEKNQRIGTPEYNVDEKCNIKNLIEGDSYKLKGIINRYNLGYNGDVFILNLD